MKNKDLIKILQAMDPEDRPSFQLGRDIEDQRAIAKAALMNTCAIDVLEIDRIEILFDEDNPFVNIVLRSGEKYIEMAESFDKRYGKFLDEKQ